MESSLATSRSLLEPLSSRRDQKTARQMKSWSCTGSQGEPMAAFSRIANGTHRQVQPNQRYRYLLFSPIPGNTTSVNKLINTISEGGCRCRLREDRQHPYLWTRGQQEQKLMLRLIKPKYFMPVHGNTGCRRSRRTCAWLRSRKRQYLHHE